jgi:hypothetical protein
MLLKATTRSELGLEETQIEHIEQCWKGKRSERRRPRGMWQKMLLCLTDAQRERLFQLVLQRSGATAIYLEPLAQERLGISQSQLEELGRLRDDREKEMDRIVRSKKPTSKPMEPWMMQVVEKGRGPLIAAILRMMEFGDAPNQRLESGSYEVLTEEQKSRFEELKGVPFDFSEFNRRRE